MSEVNPYRMCDHIKKQRKKFIELAGEAKKNGNTELYNSYITRAFSVGNGNTRGYKKGMLGDSPRKRSTSRTSRKNSMSPVYINPVPRRESLGVGS